VQIMLVGLLVISALSLEIKFEPFLRTNHRLISESANKETSLTLLPWDCRNSGRNVTYLPHYISLSSVRKFTLKKPHILFTKGTETNVFDSIFSMCWFRKLSPSVMNTQQQLSFIVAIATDYIEICIMSTIFALLIVKKYLFRICVNSKRNISELLSTKRPLVVSV
jgi:hypothetical protein